MVKNAIQQLAKTKINISESQVASASVDGLKYFSTIEDVASSQLVAGILCESMVLSGKRVMASEQAKTWVQATASQQQVANQKQTIKQVMAMVDSKDLSWVDHVSVANDKYVDAPSGSKQQRFR